MWGCPEDLINSWMLVLGLGLGLALRTINNGLGLIGQVLGLGLASLGLGTTSQEEPWSLWAL